MQHSPLIINLAPTGMVATRDQSSHLPLTADEIVADVGRCVTLGAAMVHLHARDERGAPTTDPEVMARIIEGIRSQAPDVVIVVTTSGRSVSDLDRRAAMLRLDGALKPDMASLTLGSMNFAQTASINPPADIMSLARMMRERGIKPELEVFDLGMVNYAKYLIDRDLLVPPFYFNVLLGNVATAQAKLLSLSAILAELPEQSLVALGGIGRAQPSAIALGSAFCHGVRVGLEDNLWQDAGRQHLATNEGLVRLAVDHATLLGRPIATSAQVRAWLGLAPSGGGR
jgi:uncharacterized protein (DUF849 family)